jgi:hypothetical protein
MMFAYRSTGGAAVPRRTGLQLESITPRRRVVSAGPGRGPDDCSSDVDEDVDTPEASPPVGRERPGMATTATSPLAVPGGVWPHPACVPSPAALSPDALADDDDPMAQSCVAPLPRAPSTHGVRPGGPLLPVGQDPRVLPGLPRDRRGVPPASPPSRGAREAAGGGAACGPHLSPDVLADENSQGSGAGNTGRGSGLSCPPPQVSVDSGPAPLPRDPRTNRMAALFARGAPPVDRVISGVGAGVAGDATVSAASLASAGDVRGSVAAAMPPWVVSPADGRVPPSLPPAPRDPDPRPRGGRQSPTKRAREVEGAWARHEVVDLTSPVLAKVHAPAAGRATGGWLSSADLLRGPAAGTGCTARACVWVFGSECSVGAQYVCVRAVVVYNCGERGGGRRLW